MRMRGFDRIGSQTAPTGVLLAEWATAHWKLHWWHPTQRSGLTITVFMTASVKGVSSNR